MLPGLLGEAETSFLYIQALAWHMRVVSVSYPPDVARVDDFCDGLCALLESLGIQQVTVLGGSSGGYLAQALVRRHPTRTAGLILTHTGLPSTEGIRTNRIYRGILRAVPFALLRWVMMRSAAAFFPRQTAEHAFWRAHFRDVIRCQSFESLYSRFSLMEDFHRGCHFQPDDLTCWAGNMLLMQMRRDHLSSPAEQAAMRALYPGARIHVFSDTAHYDSVERPEEQIKVIQDFMVSQ